MKKIFISISLCCGLISSHSFAQTRPNITHSPNNNLQKPIVNNNNPVQAFITKNDNILFYMEEAIKQNDVTHADYEALFTRWGQIKQIINEFKRNPKKYDQSLLSDFNEQEELFSDYVKTVYTMLVNQAASLNKLHFRFDVENLNLVIMVPKLNDEVVSEFKRSNYLNQSSSKFKEIVDLGFKEVKLTDGKKIVSLIKTPN